jgi:hypothetical protein
MIFVERFCIYISLILLVIMSLFSNADANLRIVPLHSSITFSAMSSKKNWFIPIKSIDGSTAYVLSLEPQYDVGHHIVTLELILHYPDDKTNAPNLLEPEGKWHGLQSYIFGAYDLAKGVKKSAFGKKRIIYLKRLGLKITTVISKDVVSQFSSGNYQLDTLELNIEVNNID